MVSTTVQQCKSKGKTRNFERLARGTQRKTKVTPFRKGRIKIKSPLLSHIPLFPKTHSSTFALSGRPLVSTTYWRRSVSGGMSQVRTVPPPSILFMGMSNGKNSRFPGPPRAGGICHEGFEEYDEARDDVGEDALPVEVGAKAEAEPRRAARARAANVMIFRCYWCIVKTMMFVVMTVRVMCAGCKSNVIIHFRSDDSRNNSAQRLRVSGFQQAFTAAGLQINFNVRH